MNAKDTILIGFEPGHFEDESFMIVAKQINGDIQIINTFQASEARELYLKIITKRDELK